MCPTSSSAHSVCEGRAPAAGRRVRGWPELCALAPARRACRAGLHAHHACLGAGPAGSARTQLTLMSRLQCLLQIAGRLGHSAPSARHATSALSGLRRTARSPTRAPSAQCLCRWICQRPPPVSEVAQPRVSPHWGASRHSPRGLPSPRPACVRAPTCWVCITPSALTHCLQAAALSFTLSPALWPLQVFTHPAACRRAARGSALHMHYTRSGRDSRSAVSLPGAHTSKRLPIGCLYHYVCNAGAMHHHGLRRGLSVLDDLASLQRSRLGIALKAARANQPACCVCCAASTCRSSESPPPPAPLSSPAAVCVAAPIHLTKCMPEATITDSSLELLGRMQPCRATALSPPQLSASPAQDMAGWAWR